MMSYIDFACKKTDQCTAYFSLSFRFSGFIIYGLKAESILTGICEKSIFFYTYTCEFSGIKRAAKFLARSMPM